MLKKLLRARFGRAAEPGRTLTGPADLRTGDLLTFKHRLSLPPDVQGQTFQVSRVDTYQYEDGIYPQLTLDGAEAGRVFLGFKATDAVEICLSKTAPRKDVRRIFAEDAFGALWDEDFVDLEVVEKLDAYDGWLADAYSQVKKSSEGYFYNRDCRGEELSSFLDDDAEELRYHECEDTTGRFGLTVEVWTDGDTEVTLDVNCPADVIESMWPGEGDGDG